MKQDIITNPENMEIDKIEDGKIYLKEKEIELPKTWEECFIKHAQKKEAEYISDVGAIRAYPVYHLYSPDTLLSSKNSLPIGYGKKLLALCQLLICREVYRQGWKPDWSDGSDKYIIAYTGEHIVPNIGLNWNNILSFQSEEIRNEFFENFRELIEEAKELI